MNMLQHNANVAPSVIHGGCAAQASSAMSAAAYSAAEMNPLATTPLNARESPLSQHFADSRPKRNFQFRVIQVREGPKWFIFPSLHNHQRKNQAKKKIANNNENTNNNSDNVEKSVEVVAEEGKPTKALHLKLESGYAEGSASDQENQEILSPITPDTPTRALQLNYDNVENIMANAHRIPSPTGGERERDGMVKVTATNQLAYYPMPFSEPTSRRLPSLQMPILASAPAPPSPLTNSPPRQTNFCLGSDESRGVWLEEKEVTDLYASFAESHEKYQERLEKIALRLHQNQQHNPQLQRTKSVANAHGQIADSYSVDVGYILGNVIPSPRTQSSAPTQGRVCANTTSGETSGYASTASTTAVASGNNSSAFEILAVSKKEENEEEEIGDIDFELDVDAEEHHFADSGYSVSAPATRNGSRSGSVVEYYSSSGCYTCIQGECLNANQQVNEEDLSKRYSLCLTAFQKTNGEDDDRNNNKSINNEEYICDNCKLC